MSSGGVGVHRKCSACSESDGSCEAKLQLGSLPPPQFADPDRARKLAAAFPEVERLFNAWVKQRHMPGAVVGILIDGELAWVKTAGVRELDGRAPVTPDTVFRIASMTKSFTALSILKLRDEGKLSLDDPVARYVPAAADLPYPTKDSPALTIRHLLTHSEGFPEDNPWGDQQLARSEETMHAWIRAGIPFSNAPGMAYEYSNFGFAILGQVVAKASGKRYDEYIRKEILEPLQMSASTFEASEVPRDRVALGYRWEDNTWKSEPPLGHGAFGAMGGLWTSARDLARYVGFLMSAFPPRDDPEKGPVQRSSVREMQQVGRSQTGVGISQNGGCSAGAERWSLRLRPRGVAKLPLRVFRCPRRWSARLRVADALAAGIRRWTHRHGERHLRLVRRNVQ